MSVGLPPVVVRFVGDATQFINEQRRVMESASKTAAKIAESAKAAADAAEAEAKKMTEAAAEQAAAAKAAADAYDEAAARVEAANAALYASTKATWDASVAAQRDAVAKMEAADAQRAEAAKASTEAQTSAVTAAEAAAAKRTAADTAAADASKENWAGAGKTARNTAMAMGAVSAGVGLLSLDMAAKFEKSTNLLMTAGGESQAAMGQVRDGILQIAQSTGTATGDLSNGMYILEKAGYDAAHGGLDVLRLSAQGAKAEGVDLGTMTSALTDLMFNYGAGADQAASMTNQLVKGAGEAKTTMQLYAASMASLIPVGSKVGLDFAQLGGALATVTQHGLSAQQGAENLAHAIQSLSTPTQPMINQMAQMGLNAQDVARDLGTKGLTGTMDELYQAVLSKMGPAGLTLQSAFNESKIAANDMKVMLASMPPTLRELSEKFASGELSFKDYRKGFRDMGAEGSAMGAQFASLAQRADGFNQQLKQAKPENQTFLSAMHGMVGGQDALRTALMLTGSSAVRFTENVKGISDAGKENGQDISTWATTSSGLAVQWDQLKESAGTLGIELGQALLPIAKQALGYFQGFMNWVHDNPGTFQAVAIGIGAVSIALGILAVAWAAVTLAAAPAIFIVAAVIAGIVLLGAAIAWLVTHWDDVVNFLTTVWGGFLGWVQDVMNGFVGWWNGVWGGFFGFVRDVWNGFTGWLQDVMTGLMSWWHSWWDPFAKVVADVWNGIVYVAKFAFAVFYTVVVTPFVILINLLGAAFGWLYTNAIKPAWEGIVNAATFAWNWLSTNVFAPIGTAVKNLGDFYTGLWKDYVVPAWKGIQDAATVAWNWLNSNVFTPIGTAVKALGDFFTGLWTNYVVPAWQGIQNAIGNAWNWIVTNVGQAIQNDIDGWASIFGWLWHNIIEPVWQGIQNAIGGAWNWIQDSVFRPVHDALDALGNAFHSAGDTIAAAWQRIQDTARGPVQFVVDAVYNNGIRAVWNSVAQPLGLPLLDAVTFDGGSAGPGMSTAGGPAHAFADGGVMPGYTPGRDIYRIDVSGGEAIMVPEWTRMVGADRVHAMNRAARGGDSATVQRSLAGFADGGIVDWIGGALDGLRKAALGGLKAAATPVVQGIEGAADGFLSGTGWGRMLDKGVHTLGDGFLNWIGGKDNTARQSAATAVPSGAVGAGVQQWSSLVLQALSMVGQPASELGMTLARMNQESGGNPNAVNDWDSNAAAGMPSQGLMQVIGPTFASYAFPGYSSNILDPLSNILASMRYALSRYGSLDAAYGQAGGYAGGGVTPILFDQGGYLPPGRHVVDNHTGVPERVLAPGQGGANVVVNVHSSADPYRIGAEVGWVLRDQG